MTQQEIEKALEQYEKELHAMPDEELIGEERLMGFRDAEIDWRVDEYQADLEETPDDELLDLETIREEIIAELLDQRAEELESQVES